MPAPTPAQRVLATLVHIYTASGAVLALLMVHFAYQHQVRTVLWLFLLAMFIDGTDGFLARRVRVKEVMPGFDGAMLDNIVDYLTYTFAPAILLWANGYLPDGPMGAVCASVPLLASCYQFCRTDAKTEDHFFLGFPSYWNIAAFYAIVFAWTPTTTAIVLWLLAIAIFIPVKYVYPSRTEAMWQLNMALSVVFLALYAWITATLPDPSAFVVGLSLAYVAYYLAVSLWLTFRASSNRRALPV